MIEAHPPHECGADVVERNGWLSCTHCDRPCKNDGCQYCSALGDRIKHTDAQFALPPDP